MSWSLWSREAHETRSRTKTGSAAIAFRTLPAVLMLVLSQLGCDQEKPARIPDTLSSEMRELARSPNPFRAVGGWETAVGILTRERIRSGLSVETVAALMVEIAVSADSKGDRVDAASVLIRSTQSDRAKPYASAVDRLGEIYRRSTDVGVRAVALGGIARYATPAKALEFLVPVAAQRDPRDAGHQHAAINLIAQLGTPESAAFLRDLHRRGSITDEWASQALERHAANGYRAPREPCLPPC
jgi:hypothetical protein